MENKRKGNLTWLSLVCNPKKAEWKEKKKKRVENNKDQGRCWFVGVRMHFCHMHTGPRLQKTNCTLLVLQCTVLGRLCTEPFQDLFNLHQTGCALYCVALMLLCTVLCWSSALLRLIALFFTVCNLVFVAQQQQSGTMQRIKLHCFYCHCTRSHLSASNIGSVFFPTQCFVSFRQHGISPGC